MTSKKALKELTQEILYAYKIGETVTPEDVSFLSELLKRHPDCAQKVGCGIACIRVQRDKEWGTTRHFEIERTDGTRTDFSFLKCISGADSKMTHFKKACRSAVMQQILDFKNRCFASNQEVLCAITGEHITWYETHIDHADPWTFEIIVEKFIKGSGICGGGNSDSIF